MHDTNHMGHDMHPQQGKLIFFPAGLLWLQCIESSLLVLLLLQGLLGIQCGFQRLPGCPSPEFRHHNTPRV